MIFIKAIQGFLHNDSLKSKIFKGSFWLSVGGGAEHILRFLRNMLLTRILAPELFGELANILAINAAFESFTQLGIREAIIQNPRGKEPTYLNIAWWISITRALLLFIAGFLLAPLIANFYKDQSLVAYMRVSFLTIIFNGAMSIRSFTLLKDMKCTRWTIINNGGGILGIFCTIMLSLLYHNIWALVIGYVAESVFRFVLSFCLCFYLPGLKFDKRDTVSLIKFSKGIFGLPIFFFIFRKIDVFVLGKIVSSVSLGIYSMISALAEIPSLFINMALSPMLLPVFSKITNDKKRINRYLIDLNTLIWVTFLPILAFLWFSGDVILLYVYGKEYSSQALVFFILFLSTFCRILSLPISNFYIAMGKPENQRFFLIVRVVIMLSVIFPMVKACGPTGAAVSSLLSNIVAYFLQFFYIRKFIDIRISQYLIKMIKSSIIIIPVILPPLVLMKSIPGNQIISMISGICGMVTSYGLLFWIFLKKRALNLQMSFENKEKDGACYVKENTRKAGDKIETIHEG